MTTKNTQTAANQIQSLFNMQGNQDVFKTWASMNERLTAIVAEAGTRSIDIMSTTAKEALSNLTEATQVREEMADYGKAYSDLAQKQMDLLKRSAQEIGEVTKEAGTETTELAKKAGEELSDNVAANVDGAADKVTDKVKGAVDKAGSAAKKAA